MKKLCILYVGIGRYIQLWNEFYASCEKNFCPDIKKDYYLVTDASIETPDNVHIIHQDDLGWPGNVSFRYLFFLRIEDKLKEYEYAFFFNGNTRFRCVITEEEFFPKEEEGGLIGLTWKDGTEDADLDYVFERREDSVAYIPYGTKNLYLQSGITGGLTTRYIPLLHECHELTMTDFNNGIVPVFHDESVYNKYMLSRKFKLLDSTYGRASQRDKQGTAKIVFQRKEDMLGHSYLRNLKKRQHTNTWLRKLLHSIGL